MIPLPLAYSAERVSLTLQPGRNADSTPIRNTTEICREKSNCQHGDLADMETYATCFTADLVQSVGYGGFNWYLIAGNGGCLQFDTSNGTITNESCDSGEMVELWAHPDEGNGTAYWINQWAYENQNVPYYLLADPLSSCGTPARAYLTSPSYPPCAYAWYNN
jgi:hypothetical protein